MRWSVRSYQLRKGTSGRSYQVNTYLDSAVCRINYRQNEVINVDMRTGKIVIDQCGHPTQTTVRLINRFFNLTDAPYYATMKLLRLGSDGRPAVRGGGSLAQVIIIKNANRNVGIGMYSGRCKIGLTARMCYKLLTAPMY